MHWLALACLDCLERETSRSAPSAAFCSHSWGDSGSLKWFALSEWAASFEAKHGREPLLWLDVCCIDQHAEDRADVVDKLAGLPIYLSGCKEVGASTLERPGPQRILSMRSLPPPPFSRPSTATSPTRAGRPLHV